MVESLPSEAVHVGIAEGGVCLAPNRIRTIGLGSCVGIVLYDLRSAWAGLVHVLLPTAPPDVTVPTKYADTGIEWLIEAMVCHGARRESLRAKIAGGAQMFLTVGKADQLKIGPRNVEASEGALARARIPIVARDVGGRTGRTIEFNPIDQRLSIRTATGQVYQM